MKEEGLQISSLAGRGKRGKGRGDRIENWIPRRIRPGWSGEKGEASSAPAACQFYMNSTHLLLLYPDTRYTTGLIEEKKRGERLTCQKP
jgi:hypothetical protein